VPMIVGPRRGSKAPGKSSDRLAELIDLYPTIADLAGVKLAHAVDGKSVKPLLDDPALALESGRRTRK